MMKKMFGLIIMHVLLIGMLGVVCAKQAEIETIKNKGVEMIKNELVKEFVNLKGERIEIKKENFENETKIKIQLSNGKNAEIKIMPKTASERALERLRLKVCNETNNCSIILKEVGKDNETKPVYEMNAKKEGKFLGLFKLKMKVKAEVDSDTGNVTSVKKPWWAFLVREEKEEKIIGGQKDEHGCLIPAGYSWNATEEKCVREWVSGEERYKR